MDVSPSHYSRQPSRFQHDSDSDIESDIADHGLDFSPEPDTPPRPGSRLGFNSLPDEMLGEETSLSSLYPQPSSRQRLPTSPSWTGRLSRSFNDLNSPAAGHSNEDMDITTAPFTGTQFSSRFSTPSSSLDSLEDLSFEDLSLSSSDEEGENPDAGDIYPCEDDASDIDVGLIQIAINSPTPCLHHAPLSSIPSPTKSDIPASLRKFSSLPSPLSPKFSVFKHPPVLLPTRRHNYEHHGYSRHSLGHLKCFWAAREEEWTEATEWLQECSPYDGIHEFTIKPLLDRSPPSRTPQPNSLPPPLPPLTIHPRRGDLTSLRDPYCTHMDRYFVGMPMWTISKALWMFDIHTALERLSRQRAITQPIVQEPSESDGCYDDLDASILTESSDDSDVTLVESDNDSDVDSDDAHRPHDKGYLESPTRKTCDFESFDNINSRSPTTPSLGTLKRRAGLNKTSPQVLPWQTSWYRRIDVLLRLTKCEAPPSRC